MEVPIDQIAFGSSDHLAAVNDTIQEFRRVGQKLAALGIGEYSKLVLPPVETFRVSRQTPNGTTGDKNVPPMRRFTDNPGEQALLVCTQELVITTARKPGGHLMGANIDRSPPTLYARSFPDAAEIRCSDKDCNVVVENRS